MSIRRGPTVPAALTLLAVAVVLGSLPGRASAGPEHGHRPRIDPGSAPGVAVNDVVRLRVAPAGNEVRYRVRERLLGRDFPNDAVGTSRAVSGAIVLAEDGGIHTGESRVTVSAGTFTSDEDRRDGYVRGGRLLDAANHPTIEFRPTAVRGLSGLPASGTAAFEIVGDLTVRGHSRPVVWNARAAFSAARISGTATTAFTFDDFQLPRPRVPAVLSVADTIRLEYDFVLAVER